MSIVTSNGRLLNTFGSIELILFEDRKIFLIFGVARNKSVGMQVITFVLKSNDAKLVNPLNAFGSID